MYKVKEYLPVEPTVIEPTDRYFMDGTYLLFCDGEVMRWRSTKKLRYFGSKEDAFFGLDKPEMFMAIKVSDCSAILQAEYKKLIDYIEDIESKTQLERLKLSIDNESVDIYIDNGEDEEPTHVCYWHIDEVKEDENIAIAMAHAIDLFYSI
jgi:aspartyl-tRNA synthetase